MALPYSGKFSWMQLQKINAVFTLEEIYSFYFHVSRTPQLTTPLSVMLLCRDKYIFPFVDNMFWLETHIGGTHHYHQ